MGFVIDWSLTIQYTSILACVIGIIAAVVRMINVAAINTIIANIFCILFCSMIIASDVYICPAFFKYVAFMCTAWGKSAMYLFLGFFVFGNDTLGIFASVLFWIMFVGYLIVCFMVKGTPAPICQRSGAPEFETKDSDYYASADAPAEEKPQEA